MSILSLFFEILFGVFIGIIGGGSLINVFLRVYFDVFFVFCFGFYRHYRGGGL